LERVQNMLLVISNFCQHLTPGQDAAAALESLLETHGCVISHRRRYGIELNFFTVWQHVLLEVTNPRSLLHQLQELESLLHYLNEGPQFGLTEQEKIVLSVVTPLRLADAREWSQIETSRLLLARVLFEASGRLQKLGSALDNHYFRHTPPITQFAR